jgi:hypothetical protein
MSLITGIVSALTGNLFKEISGVAKAYINKEISEADFESRVKIATEQAAAAMLESTQATIRSSPVLQRAVAFTLVSQVLVLLLYQIGPFLWPILAGEAFPAPVVTIEYAYAVVLGIAVSGGAALGTARILRR